METARISGLPGAGKTYRALELLEKVIGRGFGLEHIGFITFTRAARREASARASDKFQVPMQDLEKNCWFRTFHSAVMRILGVNRKELICSNEGFLRDVLGIKIETNDLSEEEWTTQFKGWNPTAQALQFWDIARQKLVPFTALLDAVNDSGIEEVNVEDFCHTVQKFEEAKKAQGLYDFTDYLLRFAGYEYSVLGEPEKKEPEGDVPDIPVWVIDEAQDNSHLLYKCFERLTASAIWRYVFFDPHQAIYTWAGADPSFFANMPVAKEEILTSSYRCSRAVLDRGLSLIAKNDPFIQQMGPAYYEPAREGGTINEAEGEWVSMVKPREDTLVMARTNREAQFLAQKLTAEGIPWRSNKSGSRYPLLVDMETVAAFEALERGDIVDGKGWARIVEVAPKELLQRGTKSRFKKKEEKEAADFISLLSARSEYGCTEQLASLISEGHWLRLLPQGAAAVAEVTRKYGAEVCKTPKCVVSTIHGTKGLEAPNVFLHTGITYPVQKAIATEEGLRDERRCWYVGITRAKENLTLIKGRECFDEIYE